MCKGEMLINAKDFAYILLHSLCNTFIVFPKSLIFLFIQDKFILNSFS